MTVVRFLLVVLVLFSLSGLGAGTKQEDVHSEPAGFSKAPEECCVCEVCVPCSRLRSPIKALQAIAQKETACQWKIGSMGEVGFMQIYPKAYRGLFDYRTPIGNILAADEVLSRQISEMTKTCGPFHVTDQILLRAFKRYNGTGKQAERYALEVLTIYHQEER